MKLGHEALVETLGDGDASTMGHLLRRVATVCASGRAGGMGTHTLWGNQLIYKPQVLHEELEGLILQCPRNALIFSALACGCDVIDQLWSWHVCCPAAVDCNLDL